MAFKFKNRIPSIRFEGFSEERKSEKNKKETILSKRFFVLIGVIIALSLGLIGRLGYIQLMQGDVYNLKLEKYGNKTYTQSTVRGEIVDRNGEKLVKNKMSINVIYYAPKKITTDEIKTTANFLLENVKMEDENITITERQKKDYFIIYQSTKEEDKAKQLVTKEERGSLKQKNNYEKELEKLILKRLTDEYMDEYMTVEELKVTRLVYLMQQCTAGSYTLIEGISVEEASLVGESSNLLKGININSDWTREYVYENSFARVLGNVTTRKQGLPAEHQKELLALDYQNDARVGTSGLEQEYEDLLRGIDTVYTIAYDSDGNPIPTIVQGGTPGATLRLSIDWELQQYANQLITDELIAANARNKYFEKMFLIIMDPKTGDVLVMAGKMIDKKTGEVSDYAAGNYMENHAIGSTTKGGTIYAGFRLELIHPETIFFDGPIKIQGTKVKKSHKDMGNIDGVTALAMSSNVYMFNIAMKMGGATYHYDEPLYIPEATFETYRELVGELGLGVKTGLDVPNEASAYRGPSRQSGHFLDLSIGQYDTYTNMQLAQYTATLANHGIRVQPRLLLDAYQTDENGQPVTVYSKGVTILDDVSEETEAFNLISEGFRACVTRGLCTRPWNTKEYITYAKTGTAEVFEGDIDYPNKLTIGWTSKTEGEVDIIFSAMCPRQTVNSQGNDSSSSDIAAAVIDRYYEKYGN